MEEFISKKIKTPNELAKLVPNFKKKGKKIIQCHGVFDLIHPGHLIYFEQAKQLGDVLIVSITADEFVNKGPGFPIFNETIRAKSLAILEIVDYVTIDKHTSAVEIIKKIKPDIYFKGQEYEKALNDPERNLYQEAKAVQSIGGRIEFSYGPVYSSTRFLKEYFNIYPKETKEFLNNFNLKYKAEDLIKFLKDLQKMKVLVIGETIIDQYCYCKGMGKIPKDNLVGTKYINEEVFAGGILACANHMSGFYKQLDVITVIGEKSFIDLGQKPADFIKNSLKSNIKSKVFIDKKGQTIVKQRFIDPAFFTKMFEIYYFDDREISLDTSKKLNNYLEKVINKYDLVIVNDYGHGLFSDRIIKTLIKRAKFLAAGTQTNSANYGFNLITKYFNADFVCLDEPEARLAAGDKDCAIEELIKKISKATSAKKTIITRGHLGAIALGKESKIYKTPVFSTNIVDRLGAGDAFFAISAGLSALKCPIEIVNFIGNVVGAMHVATIGNKETIEPDKVYRFIKTLLK